MNVFEYSGCSFTSQDRGMKRIVELTLQLYGGQWLASEATGRVSTVDEVWWASDRFGIFWEEKMCFLCV
jgi:hypothetical protein